jgi:chaperonin GroES
MKTTHNNVIIEPIEPDNVANGGIVIMYDLNITHHRGVVVDIGPGRIGKNGNTVPMTVKAGDVVLYPLKGGVNINIDGKSRVVIKEDEIFAISEE